MKRAVLAIAAIAAASAFADKVYLKSGTVLTGAGAVVADDKVKFTSDDLGVKMDIPVKAIAVLESNGQHVIEYKDLSRETKNLTIKDGAFVVEGKKIDMANVKAIDPGVETWHGSVHVSYESNRGNTYKNAASVLADVSRRWEKDRLTAKFGYYYSETGVSKQSKDKDTDRWEVEAQHDHFWAPELYSYENGRYEQDDIAGLDDRLRLGAGGGYLAFITGNLINMKVPCAVNARDIVGAKTGTPENEIISTLSIAVTSASATMLRM